MPIARIPTIAVKTVKRIVTTLPRMRRLGPYTKAKGTMNPTKGIRTFTGGKRLALPLAMSPKKPRLIKKSVSATFEILDKVKKKVRAGSTEIDIYDFKESFDGG